MKMFNASLDAFKVQCDGLVFRFNPRKMTECPDHLIGHLYHRLKDRGVFPIYPHMGEQEKKTAHREALLSYLGGALRQRISNFLGQEDDFKKKGVTFKRDKRLERALRWDAEIRELLEVEAPIDEELSFLDEKRRKALGFDDERISEIEEDDLFGQATMGMDPVNAKDAPEVVGNVPAPRKKGKKGPESFKDVSMEV